MNAESEYSFTLESQPSAEDVQTVRNGLLAFNNSHASIEGYEQLNVFLRAGDKSVVGGLLGETCWGWLYVKILWMDDSARGRGYGSQLLAMAEREAARRGCTHAHLDTFSFQALPFYERHDYRVFGKLDDYPVGHTCYFLAKQLNSEKVEIEPD
jgi:GNAT superfamily N-acetyltransferase